MKDYHPLTEQQQENKHLIMTTPRTRNLFQEIKAISQAYTGCPPLTEDHWLNDRVLEQSALVLLLRSDETEVSPSPVFAGTDWLRISHPSAPLALFPDADGYVDSNEILRCLNVYLSTLKHYNDTRIEPPGIELRLKHEAQPLWLLPVIPVDNRQGKRIYYLIANGQGNWRRLPPETVEV